MKFITLMILVLLLSGCGKQAEIKAREQTFPLKEYTEHYTSNGTLCVTVNTWKGVSMQCDFK